MHSSVATLLALFQAPTVIEMGEPTPPSSVTIRIAAACEARSISLDYQLNRPGPDLVGTVSVDGEPLPASEVGRINEMIGGYMLDEIAVVACTGTGDAYEVQLLVTFGRGAERHLRRLGVRNGRVRMIS